MEETAERRIEALLERGEESGCLNMSGLAGLGQQPGLSRDGAQGLQELVEARGVELSDDCANDVVSPAHYNHEELVAMTSDTLQLFLRDVRRHPLLPGGEGMELAT